MVELAGMGVNWDAVGAIGQWIAAIVTLATVVVAFKGLFHARQQAIDSLAEIQRDRALAWAPYLAITDRIPSVQIHPTVQGYIVKNIGRGPALACRLSRFERTDNSSTGHLWYSSQLMDIGSGDTCPALLEKEEHWAYRILDRIVSGDETNALVCEDRFGNRYRFVQGRPETEVWHPGCPLPIWAERS
jgi:hypothetical protein